MATNQHQPIIINSISFMINKKETLKKIKELALKIDHDIAFGGKSKGNKHLIRVVRITKFLARKMKANIFIATAGAFLHDTALPSGNDYDYLQNKKIVTKLLKPFNIRKNELNRIAECVASHEGTIKPKSLEAKVVHDADVLEKTGLLGIIRHTWKLTNSEKINHKNVTNKDIQKVLDHIKWRENKLQTNIAKNIARYLNISFTKQKTKTIITVTVKMAFDGIITEKIAFTLHKYLNKEQNKKLKEQLNLSYLNKFK